jgi:hypothetical protein
MNHHPHALCTCSVASLITGQAGHFWKADPGQFSKAPKAMQERHPDMTAKQASGAGKIAQGFWPGTETAENVSCWLVSSEKAHEKLPEVARHREIDVVLA